MPVFPQWPDIVIRLLCTIAAGVLIGLDRGDHGRPAGLRTTLLVGLAACLAMIEANLLLGTAGKAGNSFVVLDLMRLPLGILAGMGFIGAGAIVRRDTGVLGVTTAATLWFITVLGLVFGGGQLVLGFAGLGIGMLVLSALRPIESRIRRDHQGTVLVITRASGPTVDEIRSSLVADGFRITSCGVARTIGEGEEVTCQISWRAQKQDGFVPALVGRLSDRPGVIKIGWTPRVL